MTGVGDMGFVGGLGHLGHQHRLLPTMRCHQHNFSNCCVSTTEEIRKGYATFDLIRFCVRTYTQIADSLGIQVLTIPKEKQKLI